MSARKEKDNILNNKINDALLYEPDIIRTYIITRNNMVPSSKYAYLRYLSDFCNFLQNKNIDILDTKPMHIEEYIAQLKETCGSDIINARLSAIISFFAFLIENDIIDKNPCSKVKKIKKEKEESVVYLSKPEIKRIKKYLLEGNKKNNFAKRDYCLFALGVRLGLRISAILNIDIDDIDFTNKTITVIEKGNITKNVVFGEDTAEIIKMWLKARSNIINDDNKALFISAKRNRMSVRAAERVIEDCGNYIGKHISPHKLRSTCAMNLYNKTGDIYLVQQQLGHKNIQNTMIYAKASDERKREAANILDNL